MKNPKLISKPFAQNGQKNVIPEKYETSMESNQATWDQGFGQITMLPVSAGGLPPKGQDFNGILNQMCETIVHISKGGVFKFSADYATAINGYPKGAILQSEDEKKYYQSIIDNNKVNFNTASQDQIKTSWKLVMTDDLLDQLSKKLESSAVVQSTGTSTTSVMSQKASTDSFQPQGNYADKSSKELQRFNSGVFVVSGSAIASTIDGKEAGVIINNNEPCLYSRYSSTGGYRFIKIPERNGEMSLAGDSYTKTESNDKYQPKGTYPTTPEMNTELNKKLDKASISQQLANDVNKVPSLDLVTKELGGKQAKGNYQPAGNYTLAGTSYTKSESDAKYQAAGDYAKKDVSEIQIFKSTLVSRGAIVSTGEKSSEVGLIVTSGVPYLYSRPSTSTEYIFHEVPYRSGALALISDIENSELVPHPIPWSLPTAPSGYLICNGQTFNKSTYPKLATAYPSGKLPDLRGEFIRGLDNGRGVDNGRAILSSQLGNSLLSTSIGGNDTFEVKIRDIGTSGTDNQGWHNLSQQIEGKNGNETRPRNIAFLYIVRAA
ncbi:TPA: phage tail protein [Proteus mirabilis]